MSTPNTPTTGTVVFAKGTATADVEAAFVHPIPTWQFIRAASALYIEPVRGRSYILVARHDGPTTTVEHVNL